MEQSPQTLFLSLFNGDVLNTCPFCGLSENVFHVFTECRRLELLFNLFKLIFGVFGVAFSFAAFIGDLRKNKRNKVQSNTEIGRAHV